MTKEDKKLLFRYLSMALPYGVVVETQLINAPRAKYPVLKVLKSYMLCDFAQSIENVIHKPYLRPMSSMTEEEYKEYKVIDDRSYSCPMDYAHIPASDRIDWLNAHHFDYLGLIPKGLAIAVTEENNSYNTAEK
jgi:hypothetical protein